MAISRFSTSSVAQGLPKYQKLYDGVTTLFDSDFELIERITVGSGGASTVSFSSIPGTYKNLQLRFSALTGTGANVRYRLNGDSGANYDAREIVSYGNSGPNTGSSLGDTHPVITVGQATYPAPGIVDIIDYASTGKYKSSRILTGTDSNTTDVSRLYFKSILWKSTSAVTSVVLTSEGTTFQQYSTFALYGIKGA